MALKDITLGQFFPGKSPIHRLDPRAKLVALVMAAGAKRVTLTAPEYSAVSGTSVAALSGDPAINYGGLEDD